MATLISEDIMFATLTDISTEPLEGVEGADGIGTPCQRPYEEMGA